MTDPIQAMLDAGLIPTSRFSPTSRYAGAEVVAHDPGDGSPPIPYIRRRLVPLPERFAEQYPVTVTEGDRRDNLAARHLGAAELWWRLADANAAVDPRELADRPGTRLRITSAVDVPGADDA